MAKRPALLEAGILGRRTYTALTMLLRMTYAACQQAVSDDQVRERRGDL